MQIEHTTSIGDTDVELTFRITFYRTAVGGPAYFNPMTGDADPGGSDEFEVSKIELQAYHNERDLRDATKIHRRTHWIDVTESDEVQEIIANEMYDDRLYDRMCEETARDDLGDPDRAYDEARDRAAESRTDTQAANMPWSGSMEDKS